MAKSIGVYWADLHNHNEIGYGVGTLERSFALAENLLDVYAMVPHGHWPDPPATDPKVRSEHEAGFERVDRRFAEVAAAANARYRPGRFVAFSGFEWHSSQWGDYHVIFPGETGALFKADTLVELQAFARASGALLIPHHVAYKLGWRGTNWSLQDRTLSPVVEVYSEHGSSVEPLSPLGMTGHSMGGTTRSQTVLAQLAAGDRFGLVAGTDTHHGHPASYNEGLTAILADSLTRESVFAALRARHTYAVTGDRIGLGLACGPGIMGDVLPRETKRSLAICVDPLAPLEFVKLYRNGQPVQTWGPPPPCQETPEPGEWVLRLDFGWDRLGSRDLTLWDIGLEFDDAELVSATPCFSGGPAGRERMNRITPLSPRQLRVESFTSRDNPVPVNGVVLRLQADGDFRLRLTGQTDTAGLTGGFDTRTTLRELLRDDLWVEALPRFSSPKLRLGQPWLAKQLRFKTTWQDPAPPGDDHYRIKAQQTNGQMAWSTPIWFANTQEPL